MSAHSHILYVCVRAGVVLSALVLLGACVREDPFDPSRRGVFESLWRQMDERYCFFDYKREELGVDWDEVRERYAAIVNEDMTDAQLFEVMARMVGELKDGHVNISASFDLGRNWSYREDYPENYYAHLVDRYLGNDYGIASSLKYKIFDDNIGYVRCASFENPIGSGNVSDMLSYLSTCSGLIIDVRGNGGGQLTTARKLASHFTNERVLVGYVAHKNGKGHDVFSSPRAEWLEPASSSVRWQKPVVVLTNRAVFSAANDFVKCMRQCPQVTVMGDWTGGGSGMPFNSELPNGWSIRYSAVVYYDSGMRHTEFGIPPDMAVAMSDDDMARGVDTLIEAARAWLESHY